MTAGPRQNGPPDLAVPAEQLRQAVALLGGGELADHEIETRIAALTGDAMTARRLIDWLPEAFGIVMAGHLGKLTLPTTFRARDAEGQWREFDFAAEPIFGEAVRIAGEVFSNGPRHVFTNISRRSSTFGVVNKMLNQGGSIEGAELAPIALIGIPAEVYAGQRPSFLRKLFGTTH